VADFTVELCDVVNLYGGVAQWMHDYPIFDEAYRAGLNQKIVDHYWHHEIGQESVSMFTFALRRKLREIMPLYNQRYLSERLNIDPLMTINMDSVNANNAEANVDMTNTGNSETDVDNEGTSANISESDSSGRAIQQDFPQSALKANKDYASSGADSSQRATAKSDGAETSTSKTKSTDTAANTSKTVSQDNTTNNVKGTQGSQSQLLMMFRATFLNIDMEIIEELSELFMFLWASGDNFTDSNYQRGYIR
jgi:hypothetical protein